MAGCRHDVRYRETFDAHQWSPEAPHCAVATSVVESGMARGLHPEIEAELRQGQGQIGVIPTGDRFDPWHLVYRGNWIVTDRHGKSVRMKAHDFEKWFEAVKE